MHDVGEFQIGARLPTTSAAIHNRSDARHIEKLAKDGNVKSLIVLISVY